MSDKKRRDITLGEMQDECTRIGGICVGIKNITEDCKYLAVCPFQSAKRKMCAINLTDPPRFTEAQMAFFRGWFGVGARSVRFSDGFMLFDQANEYHPAMVCKIPIGWGASFEKQDERIYLAELIGKDGAE